MCDLIECFLCATAPLDCTAVGSVLRQCFPCWTCSPKLRRYTMYRRSLPVCRSYLYLYDILHCVRYYSWNTVTTDPIKKGDGKKIWKSCIMRSAERWKLSTCTNQVKWKRPSNFNFFSQHGADKPQTYYRDVTGEEITTKVRNFLIRVGENWRHIILQRRMMQCNHHCIDKRSNNRPEVRTHDWYPKESIIPETREPRRPKHDLLTITTSILKINPRWL